MIALALTAALVAGAPIAPRPLASLERTRCYGHCPAYKVVVYTDGTVEWHGTADVAVVGDRQAKLSAAKVKALVAAFRTARFFQLNDEGRIPDPGEVRVHGCTDTSHAIVTFAQGGKEKTLDDAHCTDEPNPLTRLEESIDRIVGTSVWVRGK
ncbi:MAG TPA: DUF6438 domain-containing protein [Haliangiales bacterium]|nr:DUF6438 domain-containing protein [Haliangiales bacterium]